MKNFLLAVISLVFLSLLGLAESERSSAGTPGVENNTCYANSTMGTVKVKVKGNLAGDQDVTVTDDSGKTGTGSGTPDPDGGCDESSEFKVGGTVMKVDGGKLKMMNSSGNFTSMTEKDCPEDDEELMVNLTAGTNSTGSLP